MANYSDRVGYCSQNCHGMIVAPKTCIYHGTWFRHLMISSPTQFYQPISWPINKINITCFIPPKLSLVFLRPFFLTREHFPCHVFYNQIPLQAIHTFLVALPTQPIFSASTCSSSMFFSEICRSFALTLRSERTFPIFSLFKSLSLTVLP